MNLSPELICFLLMLVPSALVPLLFSKKDKDSFSRFMTGVNLVFSCEQPPPSNKDIERIKACFYEEKERISYSIFARLFVMFCISLPFIMSFYNYKMSVICGSASCETIAEYNNYIIMLSFVVYFCFITLVMIGLIPSIKRLALISSMINSYFLKSNDVDWAWMRGCEEITIYHDKIKDSGRDPITIEMYIASKKYHKLKNNNN